VGETFEAKTKPGEKSMQGRNMSSYRVFSQQTIVKDAGKITMLICVCITWSFVLLFTDIANKKEE